SGRRTALGLTAAVASPVKGPHALGAIAMFTLDFPLYFIADKEIAKKEDQRTDDEKTALYGARTVDGKYIFAVFKNPTVAKRYIEDHKLSHFGPVVVPLPNAESFVSMLEQPSFKYPFVAFNPVGPGVLNEVPMMETQALLEALRKAICNAN